MATTERRSGGVLQPPVSVPPRKPRRLAQLRVLPRGWKPFPNKGMPSNRAECPTVRPCPNLKCEWNSWIDDGRDRRGGPGIRRAGRDDITSQVTVRGVLNCGRDALDAARRRGTTVPVHVIAELYECTERNVWFILAKALRRLREDPERLSAFVDLVREWRSIRDSSMRAL